MIDVIISLNLLILRSSLGVVSGHVYFLDVTLSEIVVLVLVLISLDVVVALVLLSI